MKLIVQIPCFNEEKTIGKVIASIPRDCEGISRVEILVVDDGSSDASVEKASEAGADHVVSHIRNQGLAATFQTGIKSCLELGADIIVNLDADNQYCAEDIPVLIAPILEQDAEIVVGARPIESMDHFSRVKKVLQRLGSYVVRQISNTTVEDAPSGFRAYTKISARSLYVYGKYTYTI